MAAGGRKARGTRGSRRGRGSRGAAPTTPRPEGEIRQSQVVTTFGPGAMVDLVDRAVVVGGLEHWGHGFDGPSSLDEPRLRRSLQPRLRALDPNLELSAEGYFRKPPECDARDPSPKAGIRALEFPRWFTCQNCRRLARATDAFETHRGRYRHHCQANRWAHAVPVRFVAACRRGHLADWPWISFAHPDGTCDRPELTLEEGALGDAARILVRCATCGGERALSEAAAVPFECSGDRPWLGGRAANEACPEKIKLLVRTASNAYFSQVVSALRLPEPEPDALTLRLRRKDTWKLVSKVRAIDQLKMLAELQDVVAAAIRGESLERVLEAIEAERGAAEAVAERPLRTAEYERFLGAPDERPGQVTPEGVEFAAFSVPESRADLPPGVGRLILVPELREVRVQVSFSRFDSLSANLQGEYDFEGDRVRPALLTLPTGTQKWLPAAEVRGEGLFFELDPEVLSEWEGRAVVQERADALLAGYEAEGHGRDFPGVRFYLLHSLAHLLLTAVSLECGYAASAIRERIYCESPGPIATVSTTTGAGMAGMAGILLSTGTMGSEGTLGGLVEEGRRLRRHLREAWDLGRLCSNDPVCAAHDPSSGPDDRRLEGAACHGCLYVAECSCERFNRYLDRALVVPTIGNPPDLAFFRERP